MEAQKTPNSQSNLEKEKQYWKHHNSGCEVILQSCSDQNIMIHKKHTLIMEKNTKPKIKHATLWSIFDKTGKNI